MFGLFLDLDVDRAACSSNTSQTGFSVGTAEFFKSCCAVAGSANA